MSNTNEVRVTKKSLAMDIYGELALTKRGAPRKNAPKPAVVKARFVEELDMTIPQAATYYHMIASGKWS